MDSINVVLIILNVIIIILVVLNSKRTKKILTDKKIINFTHYIDPNTVYTGLCVGNKFYVYDLSMTLFYKTYDLKEAERNFQDSIWKLLNNVN